MGNEDKKYIFVEIVNNKKYISLQCKKHKKTAA